MNETFLILKQSLDIVNRQSILMWDDILSTMNDHDVDIVNMNDTEILIHFLSMENAS